MFDGNPESGPLCALETRQSVKAAKFMLEKMLSVWIDSSKKFGELPSSLIEAVKRTLEEERIDIPLIYGAFSELKTPLYNMTYKAEVVEIVFEADMLPDGSELDLKWIHVDETCSDDHGIAQSLGVVIGYDYCEELCCRLEWKNTTNDDNSCPDLGLPEEAIAYAKKCPDSTLE